MHYTALHSSSRTAFTDLCLDRFLWGTRFLILFFLIFFVSGPCARLRWPSRQLSSARYFTVSYRIVSYVYICINGTAHVACNFTHTVNVAISRQRIKMESLLLNTTNSKWYMAYHIAAVHLILNVFRSHSLTASLGKINVIFFRTSVQQLTRFQLTLCVAQFLCDSWVSF